MKDVCFPGCGFAQSQPSQTSSRAAASCSRLRPLLGQPKMKRSLGVLRMIRCPICVCSSPNARQQPTWSEVRLTLRWRKPDSNRRYRVRRPRFEERRMSPPLDFPSGTNENRNHEDAGCLPRDRWFESCPLQRRVCELSVPEPEYGRAPAEMERTRPKSTSRTFMP
jgi:hypothetical protein